MVVKQTVSNSMVETSVVVLKESPCPRGPMSLSSDTSLFKLMQLVSDLSLKL